MFTHLHVHSKYSLLDGMPSPKELVAKAKALGMTSLAMTDHGYLYGIVDFYNECIAAGIKPIIGMEAYKSAENALSKTVKNKKNYHLILLAKNETGYKNLMKLASFAATKGFYYKPRVDFDHLRKYHEGIICLSACIQGEIPQALLEGDYEKAKALAREYLDIFGDDFFLELQNHGIQEELDAIPGLIRLSKELGIPLVATNDIHYVEKKDAPAQKMLMSIAWKKDASDGSEGMDKIKSIPPELYFKSEDEMSELFAGIAPDALTNTQVIADRCNVELKQGKYHLPKFPLRKIQEAGYETAEEYFTAMCLSGLEKRYGEEGWKYRQQLNYEMETITSMGFIDYFLIVSDFIKFAKQNGVYVGPGRGSAAGSMVAYCLEITELDPIKYGLVFERFLNPERVTMPDVDIDFEVPEGRESVLDYVTELYGESSVCQIITFSTLAGKSAIDDVARVLGVDRGLAESIKKMIPKDKNNADLRLKDAIKESRSMQKLYNENPDAKRLIAFSAKVEGALRQPSKHAAGVIIAPAEVTEYIPVCLDKKTGALISQFYMGSVESVGMLKFDFLGLKNLTILKSAIQAVEEHTGEKIDLKNIPLDDPKVYQMLSRGDTTGVFQLESSGMRSAIARLMPTSLEDIIAVVALYRPGPMQFLDMFIENKHDPSKIVYKHPILEPILKDTYGSILYQGATCS